MEHHEEAADKYSDTLGLYTNHGDIPLEFRPILIDVIAEMIEDGREDNRIDNYSGILHLLSVPGVEKALYEYWEMRVRATWKDRQPDDGKHLYFVWGDGTPYHPLFKNDMEQPIGAIKCAEENGFKMGLGRWAVSIRATPEEMETTANTTLGIVGYKMSGK